eukprot:symbB.v1.2.029183.t1/scaffold3167.1/size62076/5
MGKLPHIVNRYWNEMLPFFLVPLAFVAVIATMAFPGIPIYAMFLVLFPFFFIIAGSRFFIVWRNQGLDQEIHQLCGQLTSMTGGTVKVEYRTAWTGFCKPKHARTARIIAFVPSGGVQIPGQTIMVQVPPEAVAGQTLQIQTPQGIQMATIPSGVSAGQTFAFTPGAPQVVQAQVVQAQVVETDVDV